MQQLKQTPDAFQKASASSITGTRHALKLICQFVTALVQVRSSNLVKIANAVQTEAEPESVYRQIQRFLKSENELCIDYLKLLKLDEKLKLVLDRTEWKFGSSWINILCLSVCYKQVTIPLLCQVMTQKGNATSQQHIAIIKRFAARFGKERILRIYADREFGSRELFSYLDEEQIDFHIRLKASHLAADKSFKRIWRDATQRVKLKGRVKVAVFGVEVFLQCVKYKKAGKTEYLIVASRERNKDAIEEYKVRWQIETMLGCLKSRGFNFEETHLTMPARIAKLLMLLGLGLCLAMLMGAVQVERLKRRKLKLKKNKRLAKSLFRIGLDALQNVLFNRQKKAKEKQLQAFIDLLSCA